MNILQEKNLLTTGSVPAVMIIEPSMTEHMEEVTDILLERKEC